MPRKVSKKKASKKLTTPEIISAEYRPEDKATALVAAFQPRAEPFGRWNKLTKIETQKQYNDAGSALNAVRDLAKAADMERKELVVPLKAVTKKIDAKFKAVTDPLKQLANQIESLRKVWYFAEKKKEEKKLEAKAKRQEKKGNDQVAEDLREEAVSVQPVSGFTEDSSARPKWIAKVVDEKALVEAWLAGTVDEAFIEINFAALNAVARTAKSKNLNIPGVEGFADVSFRKR